MLRNDAPESTRVRRADGFAFVKDSRVAVEQWSVDDVGVAYYPADVRSRPEDVSGVNAIDMLHGPFQGHRMTAVVAYYPFRLPSGAGRIEYVEGISSGHRNAVVWLCRLHHFIPVTVEAGHQFGALHRALKNDALFGFVTGDSNRFVEEGLVRNDSLAFQTARGRNHHLRLGVVDARRQFV